MDSPSERATAGVTVRSRGDTISGTVVAAVAQVREVEPLELEPLYTAVDPDALNRIVHLATDSPGMTLELTFEFEGCHVRVTGAGDVEATPLSAVDDEAGHDGPE